MTKIYRRKISKGKDFMIKEREKIQIKKNIKIFKDDNSKIEEKKILNQIK